VREIHRSMKIRSRSRCFTVSLLSSTVPLVVDDPA
jgi:hypothetical protein